MSFEKGPLLLLSAPLIHGAIIEYINQHNENPKPFIWTKSAKDILAKGKRARAAANK